MDHEMKDDFMESKICIESFIPVILDPFVHNTLQLLISTLLATTVV